MTHLADAVAALHWSGAADVAARRCGRRRSHRHRRGDRRGCATRGGGRKKGKREERVDERGVDTGEHREELRGLLDAFEDCLREELLELACNPDAHPSFICFPVL